MMLAADSVRLQFPEMCRTVRNRRCLADRVYNGNKRKATVWCLSVRPSVCLSVLSAVTVAASRYCSIVTAVSCTGDAPAE